MNKKTKTPTKTARKKSVRKSATPQLSILRAKSGITSIKVIGVGGGGGNVVTRMMEGERLRGVEFIAANTDAQDLNHSLAHKKVYMGKALTKGLGAGMDPDIGKQAAEENRSEIGELLDGADVIFITAGMGGGTGTGASPVIADIAREKGILTIAFITKPFSFEGTQRMNIAQEGLMRLKDKVDAFVAIPNDRIFALIDKDTSVAKAFSYVDDVLKNAVQGIAELINAPGIINVDFADIKAIMKDTGTTLIGIGIASGEERGTQAVGEAINSPLLETSIEGARGVLFSITGGTDLKMAEINDIARTIASSVDQSARIIFGAYHDRRLKDKKVKVTIIATGFNSAATTGARFEFPSLFAKSDTKEDFLEDLYKEEQGKTSAPSDTGEETAKPVEQAAEEIKKDTTPPKVDTENNKEDKWDIPAFLRIKGKKKR